MAQGPQTCCAKCKAEAMRRTNQAKYGVDNVFQLDSVKSKIHQTFQDKYGVDHYSQTEEYRSKYTATMQSRYGVDYPLQSSEFQDKTKATNLSRYGCEWASQNSEVRSRIDNTVSKHGGYTYQRSDLQDKIRQTNKLKYGDEVPIRTPEIQAKYQSTMKDKYGAPSPLSEGSTLKDKIETTNLHKYGSRSPLGNAIIRDKAIQTWMDRYNVANPFKSLAIQDKIKSTLMDKYGVDNPQKSDEIRKKTELTNLTKYGSHTYGASIDRVRATMQDPDKLDEFINFRDDPRTWIENHYSTSISLYELSKALGVDIATISKYILSAECQELITYRKSTMELDIIEYIHSIDDSIVIQHNNRTVIRPQEIDIYLPDYKFGIECNPTYTHNSSKATHYSGVVLPPTYHRDKSISAEKAGIFLFHIFGYQWTNKPDIIKSMLKHVLQYDAAKYFARKLTVKDVSDAQSKQFLNQNHLQGYTTSKVRLGLYDGSDLISLMTFSRQRGTMGYSADSADTWELTRFCTKLNTRCVGGASKLFHHFLRMYQPSRVVSFSSIDTTTGNVYKALNFNIDSYVDPGYVWVNIDTDQYYTRVACQKSNLPKLFNELDLDIINQTEAQIMEAHRYAKVYNSGLIKWVYTKPVA